MATDNTQSMQHSDQVSKTALVQTTQKSQSFWQEAYEVAHEKSGQR
jgi:hypothetical protein